MLKDIKSSNKVLIKKCHVCGHLNESSVELERCQKCLKSFLPSSYFSKVHDKVNNSYKNLYSDVSELDEKDLIIGIHVIW